MAFRARVFGHFMAVSIVFALSSATMALAQDEPTNIASADAADATTLSAARSLAQQGVRLAEAGQCAEAIEKLERAEALHHSPIVAEQVATCYVTLGRIVEGTELYRAVLREPAPAQPSAAYQRAYERAERGYRAERERIATLVLSVSGPALSELVLTIDGKAVPHALLGAARPTDPGVHALVASAPGFRTVHEPLTLAPAERRELSLTLEAEVVPPAVVALAAERESSRNRLSPLARDVDGDSPGRALRITSYTLWAAGAAALGAGAAFGFVALEAKQDLDDRCAEGVCPGSARDRLDDGQRAGNVATVALASGAALAITGTVIYLVQARRGRAAPGASGATPGLRVRF